MMRFVEDFIREEPSVDQITRIGMDTSKRFFQLHGVDASEQVALRRQLTRAQVLPFFERLPATAVAMEACGAGHHWARELRRLGHEVRLIAPQLASPMWRARDLFAGLAEEHAALCTRIAALDRRLRDWHAKNEVARRLTAIPGVGRLIASLLVMKAPDPHLFKSGRDFAAWLGLTPPGS
jgi:transposase